MKILVLVKHGYGESGGIARYTQDLLNALRASSKKVELTVLAQVNTQVRKNEIPSDIVYVAVDAKKIFSYLICLLKLSLQQRFNYVICTHLYFLPAACFLKLFQKAPILIVIYGIEAWRPKNRLFYFYSRFIDQVLSISNFTSERFLSWAKLAKTKVSILSPAVDKNLFLQNSSAEDLKNKYDLKNKLVILTIGSLDPNWSKGHDLMINALPGLLRYHPNLVYLVAGNGDDKERLERKVASSGLVEHVHFLGFVEEADKLACYRLANVFFMVGLGEGFGIVYLEALACGLPVVASKLDASAEVLNSLNTGIIVDPDSSVEVEQAILRSLQQRKIVPNELEQYSMENFQKKIDRMLIGLANK